MAEAEAGRGTAVASPSEFQFALGLGPNNECNPSCCFCHRDANRADRLTLDQARSVMERLPVRSVNPSVHTDARVSARRRGCAGRGLLQLALPDPDFYGPIVNGGNLELDVRMAPLRELPRLDSACTTIPTAH